MGATPFLLKLKRECDSLGVNFKDIAIGYVLENLWGELTDACSPGRVESPLERVTKTIGGDPLIELMRAGCISTIPTKRINAVNWDKCQEYLQIYGEYKDRKALQLTKDLRSATHD